MWVMDESKYKKDKNEKAEDEKEDMVLNRKHPVFPLQMKKDNFLIMILVGILLLVIVWPVKSDQEENAVEIQENGKNTVEILTDTYALSGTKPAVTAEGDEEGMLAYAAYLEDALEEVLSSMEGAGKVKVMVTVESSGEAVLEKDVLTDRKGTTEVDSSGGSRNTTDISRQEETVYTENEDHEQLPYVKRVDAPKVQGVLLVVQGGENSAVVKNITEAIQALFGIEAHKIKIVKMNSQ